MEEAHIAALSSCMPMLCEDLEVLEVLSRLVSANVFRIPVAERISAERTTYEKNSQLVFELRKCGENAFESFLTALRDTGQAHIAHRLAESQIVSASPGRPIHQSAIQLLKAYYSSAFRMCQPFSGLPFTFDVNSTFVSLTMKGRDKRTEDHCALIEEAFAQITYPDRKLMIIEGNAATGKTSLMRRITFDWATGKLSQFDIVLYAEFRQLTAGSYANIVAMGLAGVSVFLEEVQAAKVHKFVENLLNSNEGEKMLLLLDGYDEGKDDHCKQLELVLRDEVCPLLLSFVILSSRPEHVAKCRHNENCIAYASVLGFDSNEQKSQYIRKHFVDDGNADEEIRIVEEKLHSNQHFHELAATPLFLFFLCFVSKNCKYDSIVELFRQISIWLLKRYIKEKSEADIPELVNCDPGRKEFLIENCLQELSLFRNLGRLAFDMLCHETEDCVVFSESDLRNYEIPSSVMHIGLLATDDRLARTGRYKSFMFPHKSFQEFFAAMHFWYWCENAQKCFASKTAVKRDQGNFNKYIQEIVESTYMSLESIVNFSMRNFLIMLHALTQGKRKPARTKRAK